MVRTCARNRGGVECAIILSTHSNLVAIFLSVEANFGVKLMARETALSRNAVRVVFTGKRVNTGKLTLVHPQRTRDHHGAVVGRPAVALNGVKAVVDVSFAVNGDEQTRKPCVEHVHPDIGVAEVVACLLGVETAIRIVELVAIFVQLP